MSSAIMELEAVLRIVRRDVARDTAMDSRAGLAAVRSWVREVDSRVLADLMWPVDHRHYDDPSQVRDAVVRGVEEGWLAVQADTAPRPA